MLVKWLFPFVTMTDEKVEKHAVHDCPKVNPFYFSSTTFQCALVKEDDTPHDQEAYKRILDRTLYIVKTKCNAIYPKNLIQGKSSTCPNNPCKN